MQEDVRGRVFAITAPDPSLFRYYLITSFVLGPFFFFPLIPLYFRYHTLRYHFDDEGITMRWGILFRREISLTYARVQDIHLSSNILERWLGLAKIQIQTASGSSSAELTVEGVKEFELVRDYLYSRMRGIRGSRDSAPAAPPPEQTLAGVMNQIAEEMKQIRELLEERK